MKEISIYIHIPFCIKKCFYCDFLSEPAEIEVQERYLEALLREIEEESISYEEYQVTTIFFGGGTPSMIEEVWIEKIVCKLKECYQFPEDFVHSTEVEITIEVNPGTVTGKKLLAYKNAGINRLSIGLQSAQDAELKALGRIHNFKAFFHTFELARAVGFHNINVDIMAAIPGQTVNSYHNTLTTVLRFKPEHISAYSLILEEGTPFYENYKENQTPLPTEEQEREFYELTGTLLQQHGYRRYEISNYAKDGYECRHNKLCWQRGEYVGFGVGAASMVNNVRWSNLRSTTDYIRCFTSIEERKKEQGKTVDRQKEQRQKEQRQKENIVILTVEEQMEEYMFLGLRLTEGITKEGFYQCFHKQIEEVYGNLLIQLQTEGLIVVDNTIELTSYGMDISNFVMAQFLLT